MSATVSTLGIAVDTTSVKRATQDLRELAAQGPNAARSATGVESAMGGVGRGAKSAGAAVGYFVDQAGRWRSASGAFASASEQARLGLEGVGAGAANATSSLSSFGTLLRGATLLYAAKEFIQLGDASANLNAKLSLVAGTGQKFSETQVQLYQMAQQTRSGLAETADLYGRIARSTETLGVSQASVLTVTKAINSSMVISGASAQSAAAALVQLGQGFASGTLRGEELNSVLEQSPRLAQAIADGMGVSVGELRKLGVEGKLTAQEVFQAIQSQAEKLNEEFGKMPTTVAGAMTQVKNTLLTVVGEIDQKIGATAFLANFLSGVSTGVDRLRAGIKISHGAGLEDPTVRLAVSRQRDVLKGEVEDLEKKKSGLTGVQLRVVQGLLAQSRKDLAELDRDLANADPASNEGGETRKIARMQAEAAAAKALGKARKELTEHYVKSAHMEKELADAKEKWKGDLPKDIEKAIRDKYRDRSAERHSASALKSAQREADQVLAAQTRGKLEAEKAASAEEDGILKQRLDMARMYRQSDLMSEAEYNSATKNARDERIRELQAHFIAEKAVLEAQKSGTKDPSTRVAIDAEIAKKGYDTQKAIQGIQDEAGRQEIQQFIDRQVSLRQVLEMNIGPTYKYEQRLKELNELLAKGLDPTVWAKEESKAWNERARAIYQAKKETEGFIDYAGIANGAINDFLGEGLNSVLSGSYSDIGKSFENMISKMLMQAAQAQLQKALWGNSGSGGGEDGMGDGLLKVGVEFAKKYFGGGGHADGGNVSRGGLYEINERGTEVLSMGGRQYLMAGDDGYVKSAERLRAESNTSATGSNSQSTTSAAAPAVTVNVINQGKPADVSSQRQRSDGQGGVIIDMVLKEVAKDIRSGGPVADAIQGQYGVSRAVGAT